LARVKDTRASGPAITLAEKYATADFGSVTVDRVLLKKSVLSPRGPTYTTILTLSLAYQ
jgi:2'-5' RNA ligase